MGYVIHIQTPSGYIRGHQQLEGLIPEFFHNLISLHLGEVAVQRFGVITVFHQFISHRLGFQACTAENEAKDIGNIINHPLEGCISIFFFDDITGVRDVFSNFVA